MTISSNRFEQKITIFRNVQAYLYTAFTLHPMETRANKPFGKQLIVEIIPYLFFLLFLYAAVNKIIDYQKFKIQIGQSPLLTTFANQIAWIIPALEIVIAVLVIIPKTRLIGLYASFGLMFLFTVYIIAILNFSDHIPCGCGGILGHLQWHAHLIFNIFFVLLAVAGIFLESKTDIKHELVSS